ncbi:MotA/TolQ/ExbB proton channel family protein [Erythrobacter sanguineus]|jgi:biopolymer transport protein ExbB|uniref:Biopolymer transport protein ExbB n=1 Tax=Erythrobacter sanguineus TaxID=198312 RepID=A0A1M7SVJ3_9SPHN|nr:MotA/TolQ/ExbB proton channel family protein [Erythrobacter sanguineus]MCR9180273.1 MotA/TolQ/ExbB proton channel family protein [Erythrobacteraceae bacterium]SHN62587.1 outer membrane transport energization protein ExbB [Erythrobacter sanguineus]
MNLIILAAAAEAPENKFGFVEAMKEGGPVAWSILAVMIIMSVGSFYILFTKLFEQNKIMKQYKAVQTSFWRAGSLREGATKLEKDSAWRQLADDAVKAQDEHGKMTDSLESHDYMHGSMQRSEDSINAVLSGGLPFLASVGATAPFIGLLGTVIGIYRALINIGIAGSASIDKVAGPVGEALIMTAIGLLVAVPAVLAFNWLQSRNRRISELLNSFSTDILAFINSNGAVKPAPTTAAPATKPAKPATTTGGVATAPKS